MVDGELIQRLRDNDSEALREIIHAHAERLVSVAEIITGSPDLAAEAMQSALVQLWERRQALSRDTKILGYLMIATRHLALNIVQHEKLHGRIAEHLKGAHRAQAAETRNDGELVVEAEEAGAVVERALSALSPRAREIFLLHREAGLSIGEIEQLLGMSNGAVRVQLSRAGSQVGEALRRWMAGE